jgi:cell fate regulator YaaT (PSP1 superfamily)
MVGVNVVGVQFRRAGKVYDFNAQDIDLRIGDQVVVDTDRGPSLAKVVQLKYFEAHEMKGEEVKPVMRKASEKDLKESLKLTEDHAEEYTSAKVKELKLEMRVLKAEVQFGGNKVILYFSAPGRVDFRELVKQLATGLKARVELKQVGARDETKIIGGLGICGREYCCSSWLRDFVPVSIKMAKNQNLALNPSKVSGGCGRLLCCLTYENDLYSELRQKLPPRRARVQLADKSLGEVMRTDLLNQIAEIQLENGELVIVPVSQVLVLDQSIRSRSEGDRSKSSSNDDNDSTGDWGEGLDLGELMDD